MNIPEIGQTVDPYWGKKLCLYFGLPEINSIDYISWVFDGCSGIDDKKILKFFYPERWRLITYRCCLIHDLRYAYGNPESKEERKYADKEFSKCLRTIAKVNSYWIFWIAVRLFGGKWLKKSYSWGFASFKQLHG